MLPKPELAYFAIADISGYTSFLAGVELDHAQDIIADFMDTVVKGLRPPFRLAKFEGDAAFVYTLAEKVDGSLLQDSVESAYFKFRRRLRDVKQASICECKACVAMGDLDFKFVLHYGEMVKQKMGGREELAGRDVILVHRLLENSSNRRRGIGTENHCMHGKDAIVEEVLDWRPFDYFTASTLLPIPGAPKIMMTHAMQDRLNGITRIEMRVAKPKPKDKAFVDQAGAKFKENITKAIGNLRVMLEGQQPSIALIDEPPLKLSSERVLTKPGNKA